MAETIINSNQLRASGDTSSQTLIGANQVRQSGDTSSQTLINPNQIAGGGTPYLESDGSAWCHMVKSGTIIYTKWEIDCAVDSSLFDSGWNLVFGYVSMSDIYGAGYNSNTGVYGGFNGSSTSPINTYTKTTDRQIISTTLQSAKTSSCSSLPLFATYDSMFGTKTAHKMKIYSAKFYNGDTLVLDLVPKEENGVAGMYDNISGNFFTNQGSGNFTYGEE